MKHIIIIVISGIILSGIVGIKAIQLIESNQVIYKDNQTVDVALNNLFDELKEGKELLADAISSQGVETTCENTLAEMAYNVDNISDTNATLTTKVTELEAQIAALNNTLSEQQTITTTILYDDEITAASTVTLTDDYTNYDYIEVYGDSAYTKIIPSEENIAFVSQYTSNTNYRTCRVTFSGNQATTGTYYRGSSNSSSMKINRIVGIKIN